MQEPKPERIQKVLANAGLGSRREIEGWIEAGEITVNSKTATLGQKIVPGDDVRRQGRKIQLAQSVEVARRVLLLRKHAGHLVTRKDPEGRDTVFQGLPRLKHGRWIAVGRLDINTSGLLLLTTDGELARRLMHPRYEIEREYAVRVLGEVTPAIIKHLQEGVQLDDGPARFERVADGGGEGANRWYNVVLREGRNRIVRRLWESQGLKVSRLIRVRFGPYSIPRGTKAGSYYELSEKEMRPLLELVGMKSDHRA